MRRFSTAYLRETRRGMWEQRDALVSLRLDERERILDVGCGEGALTRVLKAESDGEVVGCDRDVELLSELASPAVRGDATELPFADDSFELVVCQALLINLPDPTAAVREFARVASETVASIEPDNSAVVVESTAEGEVKLAARARRRYLDGVGTDVALGSRAVELFRDVGLSDVAVERYEHELVVEPPYSESDLRAASRKASGAGLRERRETMAGSEEALDSLRREWRRMGRTVVEQLQSGEYRRRERVPFYIVSGEL